MGMEGLKGSIPPAVQVWKSSVSPRYFPNRAARKTPQNKEGKHMGSLIWWKAMYWVLSPHHISGGGNTEVKEAG